MAEICANHPTKKAVKKCKKCGKLLCPDCIIQKENGIFCSLECYQAVKDFTNKVMDYAPVKKKGGLIKKAVILIILLAVIIAVAKFVFNFDVIKLITGFF